jgi:hypothetical protein
MRQEKSQCRSLTRMLTPSEIVELRRKSNATSAYALKAFGVRKDAGRNHGALRRIFVWLRKALIHFALFHKT